MGIMKITVAQINPIIGDILGNRQKIITAIEKAKTAQSNLVLFPELTLCGYPPDDFLLYPQFIKELEISLDLLLPHTIGIAIVVGTARKSEGKLFNSAAVLSEGKLLGFQDKSLLPTYDVFDERRYFQPAEHYRLFDISGKKVGITVCEDIWQHSGELKEISYICDPVKEITKLKPDIVLNLSASPYQVNKFSTRFNVASKVAKTAGVPFVLCNQVGGNDSLIFDGYSLILNEKGELLYQLKGFEEDIFTVDVSTLKPEVFHAHDPLSDLWNALTLGLKDYFYKSGFKTACLGLSGGIDSALSAALAVEALGKDHVVGVAMPSRFSSLDSLKDAEQLASNLGIRLITIPIEAPFKSYLSLLEPFFEGKEPDTTEENLQARIRGMILMALSNKHGYLVLSTGNKSEMAMGYSTLYGDLAGGLALLSDVTKERVYQLAHHVNRLYSKEIIPLSTIEKPPSAELRPNQKDSDFLPSYSVVDAVLEGYIEQNLSPEKIAEQHHFDLALVKGLIKKIHASEYKRRQAPPGLRVTEKAFTVGRRFPIVQKFS